MRTIKGVWAEALVFYRAEWRYPGAAVVWIVLSLLQPVVMLAIWTNVEGIGGGAGGARLTAYFSMAFVVAVRSSSVYRMVPSISNTNAS